MGGNSVFDIYDPQKAKGKLGDFFSHLDNDAEIERKKRELNQPKNQEKDKENPSTPNNAPEEKTPEEQRKAFYDEWNALAGMQGTAPDF